MKLKPIINYVVVVPEKAPDSIKGIILPDVAKKIPMRGRVLAVGPGSIDRNGRLRETCVKAGDDVIYPQFAGADYEFENKVYRIMQDQEILAKIEK